MKAYFAEEGLPRTLAIAHGVFQLCPVKVVQIWHSPHTVAAQTAMVYERVFRARTQGDCSPTPSVPLDLCR